MQPVGEQRNVYVPAAFTHKHVDIHMHFVCQIYRAAHTHGSV